MSQIKLHEQINKLLINDPSSVKAKEILVLISQNIDAKQYFFTKADARWLDWLWENKFLDAIKQKSNNPDRYSYRMPEVNYLVKVAEEVPEKVVDIMLAVPVSSKVFNPEILDRFLWISSSLPAEQLTRILPKIIKERWIPLMNRFNEWGFEYDKMFKTLSDVEDYGNLLFLAEAILAVKTTGEFEKDSNNYLKDTPFYLKNLSYTKVFKHIISVDSKYEEEAIKLVARVMSEIVSLESKTKDNSVFPIRDAFHFFDVDFFSLNIGQSKHYSSRGDVQELMAIFKILSQRLIENKCGEDTTVKNIYDKYIKTLPDSETMWRFRLFVMSLCPEVFKDELRSSFHRVFKKYPYHEIISGTEYKKALHIGFPFLSNSDQRVYVKKVFKYFTQKVEDAKEVKWNKRYGWEILSSICEQLIKQEKEVCKKLFDKECDETYEPETTTGKIMGGTVSPKGPVSPEEFNKIPIDEIVEKLKNEWSPENLYKKYKEEYKGDDFLKPCNAEGAGKLIKEDIPKRLQAYIDNASLFFDRDSLERHYSYSFFRGVEEAIKNNKEVAVGINWDELMSLFNAIKKSGEEKEFSNAKRDDDKFDVWLANWAVVHSAMSDVTQLLIGEGEKNYVIEFSKHKDILFDTIGYLLTYRDPVPADEELETAKSKMGNAGSDDYSVTDPYSMAINAARGRAFQAYVLFVYRDGKGISDKAKKLYEEILSNEDTRALMSMFGRFVPSFYFRDKVWLRGLLTQIFSEETEKEHLYLAAWEGYLSRALYEEIFFDENFQRLYERGLDISSIKESHRRYFKDPEESIATHLALAFMHYKNFGFNHSLFKAFWEKDNTLQHSEFIGFLGRMFISGKNDEVDKLVKENELAKKRLGLIWDWVLNRDEGSELFTKFGFWMNLEKNIFDIPCLAERINKTLVKSKGIVDWDYGLAQALSILAEKSPENTIEIAKSYLLEGGVKGNKPHVYLHVDREWFEALEILYKNPGTKKATYKLIDDLIREGGNAFWKLEDIVKE